MACLRMLVPRKGEKRNSWFMFYALILIGVWDAWAAPDGPRPSLRHLRIVTNDGGAEFDVRHDAKDQAGVEDVQALVSDIDEFVKSKRSSVQAVKGVVKSFRGEIAFDKKEGQDNLGQRLGKFLGQNRAFHGVAGVLPTFTVKDSVRRANGTLICRLQTFVEGIPVYLNEIAVDVNANADRINAIRSNFIRVKALKRPDKVSRLVMEKELDRRFSAGNWVLERDAQLVWFNPALNDTDEEPALVLCWKVLPKINGSKFASTALIIDAKTGKVLYEQSLNHSALDRKVGDWNTNTLLIADFNGPISTTDVQANSVFRHMSTFYNLLSNKFNRNSYDGWGGMLQAYVHARTYGDLICPDHAGSWREDYQLVYLCDGFDTQDLVLHEFAHGMTNAIAGFNGDNFSASLGISEAYSDLIAIFASHTWEISTAFGRVARSYYSLETDQLININEFSAGKIDCHNSASLIVSPAKKFIEGDYNAIDAQGWEPAMSIFYKGLYNMFPFEDFYGAAEVLVGEAINQYSEGSPQACNLYKAFDMVGLAPDAHSLACPIPVQVGVLPAGAGTIARSPNKTAYKVGEPVYLTALPNSPYYFKNWIDSYGNTLSSNTTYTLWVGETPAENTLSATFERGQVLNLAVVGAGSVSPSGLTQVYHRGAYANLTATPSVGNKFVGWSGDGTGNSSSISLLMDRDRNLTASFSPIQYSLIASLGDGGGTQTLSPAKSSYLYNENVTVTATPAAHYVFDKWTGTTSSSSNPLTLKITKDEQLYANYSRLWSLSTTASPVAGGVVTRSVTKPEYVNNTPVTITATPAAGFLFKNWSGGPTTTSSVATVYMLSDMSITANFVRAYVLTVSATTGGSVSLSPTANSQSQYAEGTSVTLKATPISGYGFSHWQGDATGNATSVTIQVNGPKTITAIFKPTYTLTIPATAGGSVILTPNKTTFLQGESVQLQAVPSRGYHFDQWTGAATGKSNPIAISMDASKSVNPVFKRIFLVPVDFLLSD